MQSLEYKHEPGTVTMQEHHRGVRFGFIDGTWDVTFPAGWHPVSSDEDDLWCWNFEELRGRIRLRRHPRIQLEVDVTNAGPDVAHVMPPTAELSPTHCQVSWFAGSAGEVLRTLPVATVLWVQQRGSCVAGTKGCGLFPDPLLLRPGQGASAVWRRTLLPPDSFVPEPGWVPRQRYLPHGEVLDVEHTDAALAGDGLQILTTVDGSEVRGDEGLHQLSFLDARGTAVVEVGWFAPLTTLAGFGSVVAGADPNLVAWLLAGGVDAAVDLDALDVALAKALERPTAWGVLAGMRAVTRTELPVAAEVRDAARLAWEAEPDPHLRRLLVTHGLLCGWEPEMVARWLESGLLGADDVATARPQDILASIGFGRITSSAPLQGGRDVALAGMWLSARGESVMASEWEHAVDVARRRLMCELSERPVAVDIAWLLAEALTR